MSILNQDLFRLPFINILLIVFFSSGINAQTTTTNLRKHEHINIFLEATTRIRCICLPSLPIKSCSFNMCSSSSYLKKFIENRILEGMTADEIVNKMENGFGDSVLTDPVIKHFRESGNEGMIHSITEGFGPSILATPDSTWINATLFLFGLLGLGLILYYFKTFRKQKLTQKPEEADQSVSEIQDRIREWEKKER